MAPNEKSPSADNEVLGHGDRSRLHVKYLTRPYKERLAFWEAGPSTISSATTATTPAASTTAAAATAIILMTRLCL